MAIGPVTRELLVRYLDAWVPAALHARRVTFVQSWPESADVDAAETVLRVFAEFGDRMRGRQVTLIFLAPELGDLDGRLRAVQQELNAPSGLSVHAVAGRANTHLNGAIKAAQPAGAPLLVCAVGAELGSLAPLLAARPGELLLLTDPSAEPPELIQGGGFELVNRVDLVAEKDVRRVVFATSAASHLEAYKNALWQLDEYAGVSIRDPHDADAALLDISLTPPLGPLRREIAAYLAAEGPRSVTEVRWFALTETVYRAADATKALTAMIAGGAVDRSPEHGRLAGDTVVRTTARS